MVYQVFELECELQILQLTGLMLPNGYCFSQLFLFCEYFLDNLTSFLIFSFSLNSYKYWAKTRNQVKKSNKKLNIQLLYIICNQYGGMVEPISEFIDASKGTKYVVFNPHQQAKTQCCMYL